MQLEGKGENRKAETPSWDLGAPVQEPELKRNYQRCPEINRGFRVSKMMPTQKQSMELLLIPQQT